MIFIICIYNENQFFPSIDKKDSKAESDKGKMAT